MASALKAVDPAAAGHNDNLPAIFRVYVSNLASIDEKIEALKSQRRGLRKRAKAEGIELKLADAIITMADWEPDEIREQFALREQYARFMNLPIGTQGSLFDDARLPEVERSREKWRARGHADGIRAKGWPDKPPTECHPDCAQAYGEGWEAGQKEIAEDRLKVPEPA